MTKRNAVTLAVTVGIGTAFFVSCSIFQGRQGTKAIRGPVVFRHEPHVHEKKMRCDDCHQGALHEAKAGMPALDTCMDCHENAPKGSPVGKAMGILRARKAKKEALWRGVETVSDLIFHHGKHGRRGR